MNIYNYQQTGLGKLFLKLFFFSFLLSLILSLLYIFINNRQYNESIFPLVCVGSLFLTGLLSIASFPGLFIAKAINENGRSSFIAYFLVPVAAMITVLFSSLQEGDKQFYFIIAASYTLVSGFFYLKKTQLKKINIENTQDEDVV
jgi:hypothetical protein